jgi:hypothetical protein
MDGRKRRAFVTGLFGTILIFVVLAAVIGVDRVLSALKSAEPATVALTFLLALCWLAAWSLMLRTVLATLDAEISIPESFFVYTGAVFANNVTPFGQAGGEPVAAALISKVSGTRYETALVSIASVDVLNVVPSISLILVGVGYYATASAVSDRVETAVGSAIVLIGAIALAMVLVWRYRHVLVERLPSRLAPYIRRIRRGRVETATVEADITNRLQRFFENIERIATNRRNVTVVVALSLAGWLFQAAALMAAFDAVGYSVSLAVLVFVIPLANLAGAAPLPGGLGGIEAAFIALLIPTTGIGAASITAAVLIFRGAIYWMPVVIGGTTVSVLGIRAV